MELKFTATVTLSEADIRKLIEDEIMRRHKDVKVIRLDYNINQSFGINMVGGSAVPNYVVQGATAIVEKSVR